MQIVLETFKPLTYINQGFVLLLNNKLNELHYIFITNPLSQHYRGFVLIVLCGLRAPFNINQGYAIFPCKIIKDLHYHVT